MLLTSMRVDSIGEVICRISRISWIRSFPQDRNRVLTARSASFINVRSVKKMLVTLCSYSENKHSSRTVTKLNLENNLCTGEGTVSQSSGEGKVNRI